MIFHDDIHVNENSMQFWRCSNGIIRYNEVLFGLHPPHEDWTIQLGPPKFDGWQIVMFLQFLFLFQRLFGGIPAYRIFRQNHLESRQVFNILQQQCYNNTTYHNMEKGQRTICRSFSFGNHVFFPHLCSCTVIPLGGVRQPNQIPIGMTNCPFQTSPLPFGQVAMENPPFIADLPTKHHDFP